MNNKAYLFVDMDGCIAEWKAAAEFEDLFEKGYFLKLRPQRHVLDAVRRIAAENNNIEVYILSAVLNDSKYAFSEKQAWLDCFLPGVDRAHRILCSTKDEKAMVAMETIGTFGKNCFLLDDYSVNLHQWVEAGGTGIKVMNGINGTNKTWRGPRVKAADPDNHIKASLLDIMQRTLNAAPAPIIDPGDFTVNSASAFRFGRLSDNTMGFTVQLIPTHSVDNIVAECIGINEMNGEGQYKFFVDVSATLDEIKNGLLIQWINPDSTISNYNRRLTEYERQVLLCAVQLDAARRLYNMAQSSQICYGILESTNPINK